ncbi:MAG: hypothetical protein HKN87_10740 [Saprospiraceae bacterium]|nr:hypothetical protein [Saprospiraceae bacterium]
MQRRKFFSDLAIQGIGLSAFPFWMTIGQKQNGSDYGATMSGTPIQKIGNWTLEEVRDIFKKEFFERNLPIWETGVVDWEYGGYIPKTTPYFDNQGRLVSTYKRLYHQGRCMWLYAYLFNHVEKNDLFLNAARAGYEFLLKYGYDEKTSLWHQRISRTGELIKPFGDIFPCIYMLLALGEYYKATGDEEVAELGMRSAQAISKELTSNHFQAYGMGPRPQGFDSYREPGTRRLGMWMHFLSALTPFLRYKPDPSLEMIAKFCVRNMLSRHYKKDERLAYEFLQHDYTLYPKNYHTHASMRVVDGFHSVETSWMCMDEALRTADVAMFTEALQLGKDVMDMLWLERNGRQGLVRYYWPDEKDPMAKAKILEPYVMNEVWVMLLLGMEHSEESWLMEWFDKSFTYAYKTGKITFPYGETLHHPRGLLFCIEILDRIIARKGHRSDFLKA